MFQIEKTTRTPYSSVNAYLILRKQEQVLLSLRQNTNYFDGYFSLVAGHVEAGEAATAGMIREASEEAGIQIKPEHLYPVHILHRKSDRYNVDIFFECWKWQGKIVNREQNKCSQLAFFPLKALPENTIDYIASVLDKVSRGVHYSEEGWC